MRLTLPYNIVNDTPADAVQVDSNYDVIADFTNSQVINRDGTVSMDAPLLLKGDPTEKNHAANKGYVDTFFPVGVMMPFGGTAAPAGQWLLCDGSSKSTTTYATLFNVLGYRYGGSGGNFNLPDMRGRFPIGMDASQTEFSATGKKGGSFTVPVPKHNHKMPHTHPIDHDHAAYDSATNKTDHTHSVAHNHAAFTTAAGGSHAHNSAYIGHENQAAGPMLLDRGIGTPGANSLQGVLESTHTHSIDIPAYTGNSGVNTTDHVHSINTPKYVGASGAVSVTTTADTGTDAVELQPPFVVVNYIIRAS